MVVMLPLGIPASLHTWRKSFSDQEQSTTSLILGVVAIQIVIEEIVKSSVDADQRRNVLLIV